MYADRRRMQIFQYIAECCSRSAGGQLTAISFLSRLTAKKKDVTTHPKMAAITGMAAEIEPVTSSSACVTQDAPDLPICTCAYVVEFCMPRTFPHRLSKMSD